MLGPLLVLALASQAAAEPPATRVFVRAGERILEHDLSLGRVVRTIDLPGGRLLQASGGERVSVNRVGQVGVALTPEDGQARFWLWAGGPGRILTRPLPEARREWSGALGSPGEAVQATLSADGRHVFWLLDDARLTGLDLARTVRVQRTGTDGGADTEVARIVLPVWA